MDRFMTFLSFVGAIFLGACGVVGFWVIGLGASVAVRSLWQRRGEVADEVRREIEERVRWEP